MYFHILLADDNRVLLRSLHRFLEQNPHWKVCDEAVSGPDVIAKAQSARPDIIVVDFSMPGMSGVEAARILGALVPAIPVIILTLYITAELVGLAKSVGVKGVVQKSDVSDIVGAIGALLRNETFFKQHPSALDLAECV